MLNLILNRLDNKRFKNVNIKCKVFYIIMLKLKTIKKLFWFASLFKPNEVKPIFLNFSDLDQNPCLTSVQNSILETCNKIKMFDYFFCCFVGLN